MSFFENQNIELNAIEVACQNRKAQGLPLSDLTCSNPTLQGYIFPTDILKNAATQYFNSRIYDPQSKGQLKTREYIAKYYTERGLKLSPEHIILTANTSEAYSFLFSILCATGDNILTPAITYPLFEFLAEYQRIQMQKNNVTQRTKALLFVSPHNPLGTVIQNRDTEIAKFNLPIICDEVFAEFVRDKKLLTPLGVYYPDLPVFHLNGISKMFALPDLKLGWIAMNDLALKIYGERLELLNDMFLSANSFVQAALPAIFEFGQEFKNQMVQSINTKLEQAVKLINSSKHLKVSLPEGGYYLFPQIIGLKETEEEIVLKLIAHGVLVHPGYFYGKIELKHLILSCLVEKQDLFNGLEKIIAGLEF
ncbi:MAG: pyridoxal phosphate-dependent aminotransferase [Deltaproteobacteria bacterium]|jgi:aspartate/methionine/tyrosine aminotransferase|nr:pyridoxal phosphate-dependent aminotransferase [Deltaproteobacteria bacterium]